MKETHMLRWIIALALSCSVLSCAHAQSKLEDVLRNPWVQQILGQRLPEVKLDVLRTDAQLCANAQFRAANAQRCAAADQAARVAAMPAELRVMIANPTTAVAMRELCLGNLQLATTNYLCVELTKGDANLGTQLQQRQAEEAARILQQAAGDQKP
jgi:hypothetical protein